MVQYTLHMHVSVYNCLEFRFTCMVQYTLHMHVSVYNCLEFRDEIPFKEGRM